TLGDLFFFFQAEDGIRDKLVTGVQTCALPISHGARQAHGDVAAPRHADIPERVPGTARGRLRVLPFLTARRAPTVAAPVRALNRSEERRVGKECRARWAPDDERETEE